MARGGQRGYGNAGRSAYSGGTPGAQSRAVFAAGSAGVAPPVNSVAPAITGTAQEGQVLTASTGTWTGAPTGYTYQWKRAGVPISGAINATRTLATADVGSAMTCTVTATNAGGSTDATSAPTATVIAAGTPVPVNTAAPVVSGTGTVGQTLTTTNGTWSNSPTGYAYQWRRGGVDIAGATASTYTLVAADAATSVACRVTATNAGGSAGATSNAIAVAALSVPAAPTVSATGGDGQVSFQITDDASSQGTTKWGIYPATSSGAQSSRKAWIYRKDQFYHWALTNGSTGYYKFTAFNAAGESPLSAEISAAAASTGFNPLRVEGVTFFTGEPFFEPIAPDFKAGSTLAASSSDGAALSVVYQNGRALLSGTFATGGTKTDPLAKTITWSETPSGGGAANISTQTVYVYAAPTCSYAEAKPAVVALKAVREAAPTYTDSTAIVVTDLGSAKPTGYTYTNVPLFGQSSPAGYYFVPTGFAVPPDYVNVNVYDPVEKTVIQQQRQSMTVGENGVLRVGVTGQTWVLPIGADAGQTVFSLKLRYSDDNRASFKEMPDPIFIKYGTGTHYLKIDAGVAVPNGVTRVWEVETSAYVNLASYSYEPGFGAETGTSLTAVADTGPVMTIDTDSYAGNVGTVDMTKGLARTCARDRGIQNLWNFGLNGRRNTYPRTKDEALGVNLVGDNVLGFGHTTMPPKRSLITENWTLNDHNQTNYAQAKAMLINKWFRGLRRNPGVPYVYSLGFWNPQNRISTALYNAVKEAADYVRATNKSFWFNDGVAQGWAVPTGAAGSSPNFLPSNVVTVTGSITGSVLTITGGTGAAIGQEVFLGATWQRTKILKHLNGATGGAGDYQLTVAPQGGNVAAGTSIDLRADSYVDPVAVHPSASTGHPAFGHRMSAGVQAHEDDVLANAP